MVCSGMIYAGDDLKKRSRDHESSDPVHNTSLDIQQIKCQKKDHNNSARSDVYKKFDQDNKDHISEDDMNVINDIFTQMHLCSDQNDREHFTHILHKLKNVFSEYEKQSQDAKNSSD
jgi:hypothetical protein